MASYHAIVVAGYTVEQYGAPKFLETGIEVAIGRSLLEEEIEMCHAGGRLTSRRLEVKGGRVSKHWRSS